MNVTPSGGSPTGRTFVVPQPGDVVAGKYTIVRVLGEGGMGIVYEATHQRLRQRVALKMLLPSMLEHEVIVSRFDREARAAAQLRGRHCVRVKDVDVTADGLPYMVMDLLEGHDLEVEIERRGWLPVPEAVDYVLQACAAMVEAHQLGIVHRDLKPSNLFLEREHAAAGDESTVVKVLDFGISKVATNEADAKLTDADAMMGTALYMSPEQVKASHSVDGRADIWALGVILYEALSGRVPWTGGAARVAAMIVTEDPPELRSLCDVPADVAAIVHKCLQRDPRNRFQDVKHLAVALAPLAPIGSAGRTFAENIGAMGSYPRVAVPPSTPRIASSPSLLPESYDDSARTLMNARGVAEDMMRPREAGTAPGWSRRPGGPGSKSRAVLVGVLVAFVVGIVAIGSVAFFVRRSRSVTPAVASAAPTHKEEPPSEPRARAEVPAVEVPAADPEPAPATAKAAEGSAPSAASATPKAPPAARGVRPASAPATAATRAGGAPKPTASTPDKPLFL